MARNSDLRRRSGSDDEERHWGQAEKACVLALVPRLPMFALSRFLQTRPEAPADDDTAHPREHTTHDTRHPSASAVRLRLASVSSLHLPSFLLLAIGLLSPYHS